MFITNCLFANNTSYDSGGISFLSSGEDSAMEVHLRNICSTSNVGWYSSALIFLQEETFHFSAAFQVSIENCTFLQQQCLCCS